MDWERLISTKRLGMEEYHDPRHHIRSNFQRDFDRMVFSSPFRRLQNKTQVFPLPGHIFVHNRLTHSLEVSSVGRSMANEVSLRLRERHSGKRWADKLYDIADIVATACLCHDLGNPPFGHSGEKTISTFFSEGKGLPLKKELSNRQWADFINFEGNANSFRVLTHQFVGRREGGFAMTYSTLASIVKYPHSSLLAGEKGKFGFFESEEPTWLMVARELGIPELSPGLYARHPLVYLMEAADDICYQIMDLEDAHKLKIVGHDELTDLFLGFFEDAQCDRLRATMKHLDDPNERIAYLRSHVIGCLVEDCARVFVDNEEAILGGEMQGELIEHIDPHLRVGYENCSAKAWEKIYRAREVVDIEIAGNRIITYLMECLVEAVLHPEKNFSRLLLEIFPKQYDVRASSVYGRIQAALDHVSAMTDVYALDLFRKLNGDSLPAV